MEKSTGMGLRQGIAALMGLSAHRRPSSLMADIPGLEDPKIISLREQYGGQLAPPPFSKTRWYLKDIEDAEHVADTGDLQQAARLMRAARKDGVYAGVLSTRTGGLVRLPKRFRGKTEITEALQLGADKTRSIFDEMFPATELALLAADGLELGVGVAELVPVVGRDHPVMVRLEPEYLHYRWYENQWYYRSIGGLIPIFPGDGQWILHMPGGRVAPWQHGLWRAIGTAYVRKEHANLHKDNWEAKLANAARVATAPQGASEVQKQKWFSQVMGWGKNTVFGMTPGYEVKLLESNGRGYESFEKTVANQNNEMIIAVAGQTVTTEGGAGFQNSDVHKSIRADLIKETADGLAYTINTQGLPSWIIDCFGEESLEEGAVVEWDVTPPKDRSSEASALGATAQAIKQLTEALAVHGMHLDVPALATTMGIPVKEQKQAKDALTYEMSLQQALDLASRYDLRPTIESVKSVVARGGLQLEEFESEGQVAHLELAPTDIAKVVRADEAREAQGLKPFGDERGEKTIAELSEDAKSAGEIDVVDAEADAGKGEEEVAA